MAGTLFKNLTIPKNCMECEWRDAEACGECELMIRNPFLSLKEQYAHCPFGVIAKRHSLVPVPSHGRLIDADALYEDCALDHGYEVMATTTCINEYMQLKIDDAPTIIPAEEGET